MTPAPSEEEGGKKKEQYALQRNAHASTRLNMQHYVWRRELGYNIQPAIPLPQGDGVRIADVATGTALWLIEVAEQHGHARCDGFDLDLSQGPPAAWLPGNVQLRQWDMLGDAAPEGAQGVYDLVHVRLVTLAFEDNAEPLVRNLFNMLKPGGWLQWDEHEFHDHVVDRAGGGDPGEATVKIGQLMRGRSIKPWVDNMPDLLSQHGFTHAQRFATHPDPRMRKFETDLNIMAWDEIVNFVNLDDKTKALYKDLTQKMKAEALDGTGIAAGKIVTIAKKPLD